MNHLSNLNFRETHSLRMAITKGFFSGDRYQGLTRLLLILQPLWMLCHVGCVSPNRFVAAEESALIDGEFQQLKLTNGVKPGHLAAPDDEFRLNVGDTLQIEIADQPNSIAICVVMPDGLLYFDLAGGVVAANKTVEELEEILTEKLRSLQEYNVPTVTANVINTPSRTYTVLGQVGAPGSYSLAKPTRILDAVAICGGIKTGMADLRRSMIIRDNETIYPDFEALVEKGDMSQNLFLHPGDYIFVPLTGRDKVHILGQVNGPTSLPYDPNVSLITAIAAVGGPTPSASFRRIFIVRGKSTAPRIATVNLDAIMKGKAPDVRLHPDDIVWVPKSPWGKLEEYANDAVRTATSSLTNKAVREIFHDDPPSVGSRTATAISAAPATAPASTTSSSAVTAPSIAP